MTLPYPSKAAATFPSLQPPLIPRQRSSRAAPTTNSMDVDAAASQGEEAAADEDREEDDEEGDADFLALP